MKVIHEGKLPVPQLRIFRGTCSKCGCQVECDETEAIHFAERHIGGKEEWSARCPTWGCLAKIILSEVVFRGQPMKATMSDINKTLAARPEPFTDVHTEHCCVRHGCKYGKDEECTVMTHKASQSNICERCENDGIRDMHELKRVIIGVTQTCPYCCHTLP